MDKKSKILKEYDENSKLYECFANKVKQLLEELVKGENISYNAITCRLKEQDSLIKKIEQKQEKYNSLKDLTDIAGIRIITYYSDDVDKVVDLVEKEFKVDRDNTIDKRKAIEPDRFGYCSVHYIVSLSSNRLKLSEYKTFKGLKCEIQIRTVLQHAWAEIEHDLGYKSEIVIPKDIRRNFSRLAGLLEIADKEFLDIRTYLNNYVDDITDKINDVSLSDKELDAIILNEFITKDSEIKKLNKTIGDSTGLKIRNDLPPHYEELITRLQWLGVKTLGQVKNLIEPNKGIAVEIAKNLLISGKGFLDVSVGMFYLCYAELLRNYHDYDSIYKFLCYSKIDSKSFVNSLIEIQKQLDI